MLCLSFRLQIKQLAKMIQKVGVLILHFSIFDINLKMVVLYRLLTPRIWLIFFKEKRHVSFEYGRYGNYTTQAAEKKIRYCSYHITSLFFVCIFHVMLLRQEYV